MSDRQLHRTSGQKCTGLARSSNPLAELAFPELLLELQAATQAATSGATTTRRFIEFLPELPKTATGKLQRVKLREREAKPK